MADRLSSWLLEALDGSAGAGDSLAVARLAPKLATGDGKFRLTSAAFEEGEELDPCFTATEEDAVAPPLEWSEPPAEAVELALIVERPAQGNAPFCHWLVWGLSAQQGKLLEGEAPPRAGKNAFGNSEWALPQSPAEGETDHYVFQLFALDVPVALMPGANRDDLLSAMDGHVVGCALLTATFSGVDDEDDSWDEGE